MNVEALDGFFAALIAGPDTVMPSEYYREVFGGEMSDACEFGSLDEANEILGLMMRHWNNIAGTLNKDEVCAPLLLQDENGVAHDEERGGCLVPMMMLFHEHDEDPEMTPSRSARRSTKKLSFTSRLGYCSRIGIFASIDRSAQVPT